MNDEIEKNVAETKGNMNNWATKKHAMYLRLSFAMISLAVVAIGYVTSYLLAHEYHSEKYEICITNLTLVLLFCGLTMLIVSCVSGFMHLHKNLIFFQGIEEHFVKHYTQAIDMKYKRNTEKHCDNQENSNEYANSPSRWWWNFQIYLLILGMIFLISWVVIDFFTKG